jgi:hypothetical protein
VQLLDDEMESFSVRCRDAADTPRCCRAGAELRQMWNDGKLQPILIGALEMRGRDPGWPPYCPLWQAADALTAVVHVIAREEFGVRDPFTLINFETPRGAEEQADFLAEIAGRN